MSQKVKQNEQLSSLPKAVVGGHLSIFCSPFLGKKRLNMRKLFSRRVLNNQQITNPPPQINILTVTKVFILDVLLWYDAVEVDLKGQGVIEIEIILFQFKHKS